MRFGVDSLLALGRVQSLAVAPDGTWLAVEVAHTDRVRGLLVPQLHRVDVLTGAHVQLTHGPLGARSPCFAHDGGLAFLRPESTAKDAPQQVFRFAPNAVGEPRRLTDEPLGVRRFAYAARADVLVVETPLLADVPLADQRHAAAELRDRGPSGLRYRRMPIRHWDHWLELAAPHLVVHGPHGRRDLTPHANRDFRAGPNDAPVWALSDDGAFIVAVARTGLSPDRVESFELRRIETAGGETRTLRQTPFADHGAPLIAPSGRHVAVTERVRSPDAYGRVELLLVSTETGEATPCAPEWDAWPTPECFTPDSRDLLVTVEERGHRHVHALHLATGTRTRVTSGDGSHELVRVLPNARRIVGLRHTLREPPEPFSCALAEGATPELVTRLSGMPAPLAGLSLESFEVVAPDGTPVQSFLLKPASDPKPPVLFWIHGGPVHQFADAWHWRWCAAIFAAAGFAVVLPNPRGSTGRGQAFVEAIWSNAWGGACYEDLMAVADAVAKRADVDGERMAAMGGSFGGYMANWIGGSTTRFRAIVTHASIFNFETFALTTDYPAWFAVGMGGRDPLAHREDYDRYSPHRRIASWRTPTLVIHGEKDYRCPVSESLMLFEALQARGVESELLVFPDEGHWITKPRNVEAWYGTILEFIGRHLAV
jgi:dipeptidyl aminopeptidase/acylaminoacyl peptidase